MLSHQEANFIWEQALRRYAQTTLQGDRGPYLPIGSKTMALLDPLWAYAKTIPLPDLGLMLRQGKDVRFFSDPHFEHANIIKMCERPHADIAQMDQSLWSAIEEAHQHADFVVCLGDWSLKNPVQWQRKIHALFEHKHVTVIGNHDAKGSKPDQWLHIGALASLAFSLDKELAIEYVTENNPDLVDLVQWELVPQSIMIGLSHWPVPPDRLPGSSWINLHGHVHNQPNKPLRVNCSMEAIGYHPQSIRQLIDARLIDELVRRQSGLDHFIEPAPSYSSSMNL